MRINNTDRASKAGLSGTRQADSVTVQLGERKLADVAQRAGVDLKALTDANPLIKNPNGLKVGQDVRLPQSTESPLRAEVRDNSKTAVSDFDNNTLPTDTVQKALIQGRLKEALQGSTFSKGGTPPSGVLAFGKDDIPPATLTELAGDKIAKRVEERLNRIPDIKSENYPKLTNDEKALADLGSGVAKYKEYVDYAKTALEVLKPMPDSPEKRALMKTLGNRLESVAEFIDGVSKKLGTISKYANYAKDAVGFADAARDFANDFKDMKFSDTASVQRMMDSLGKANDKAQGFFSGMRDFLISKGTSVGAQGALALSYATIMITAGIELGRAGVKAERSYLDRLDRVTRELENGTYGTGKQLPVEPAR